MEPIILIILLINSALLIALMGRREAPSKEKRNGDTITIDTSSIIDGRVLDVAKAGFLPTTIRVPQFIIDELHQIADSSSNLKRERGRFGLEVINELQKLPGVDLQVTGTPSSDKPVDDRLVEFTKKLNGRVVTNDYALIQIARLNGVSVLNVNELSQAIRTLALPGETVEIKIVQPGSDPKQGVGYLDDGTMVVVEDAKRLIGQSVTAEVNRVFQTAAGKMLFARMKQHSRKDRQSR